MGRVKKDNTPDNTVGKTITIIRKTIPMILSLCIYRKYASVGRIPDKILEPSNGGTGNKLNTAKLILTEKNNTRKFIK
jgi:hypothetical protein